LAIVEAAERYDEPDLMAAIREARTTIGWRGALGDVLFPALRLVGERWERGELPLSSEHFASSIVRRELLAAIAAMPQPPAESPCVVLACPEDERHDMGVNGLWLLLRDAGVRVIFLGADVPSPELVSTLRRTDAAVVSLSATAPNSLPMMGLAARALVSARVRARVFVGGPALDESVTAKEIPGVRLPGPIGEAADALIEALHAGSGGRNLTEDTPIEFRSDGPEVDS
jgi:methanogenic corrinoid protein MtbC1